MSIPDPSVAALDHLARGWAQLHLSVEAPERFPSWDVVIITASSPVQAALYERQLAEARSNGRLAQASRTLVVADRDGKRIGSGAATLGALREAARLGSDDLTNQRILIVQAGGDSRRLPWANLLGKPFVPFPVLADPDRPVPTVFDHLLALAAPLAVQSAPGTLVVLTGDVLPLFDTSAVQFPANGALVVTTPVSLDVAERHGVIVAGADDTVRDLLQKAGADELASRGALVGAGAALLDTGIQAFTGAALAALAALANEADDPVTEVLLDGRECSLYDEVAAAFVPARHDWLRDRPLGRRLAAACAGLAMVQHRADDLAFVHLGSSAEVLEHLAHAWGGRLDRAIQAPGCGALPVGSGVYVSHLGGAVLGEGCLVYRSRLGPNVRLGNRCVAIGLDIGDEPLEVPAHVSLWQVPVTMGTVTAACGVDDNPKDPLDRATFLGRGLKRWLVDHGLVESDLWAEGQARILWNARLFPVQDHPASIDLLAWILAEQPADAEAAARWRSATRHSLGSLHAATDVTAWEARWDALAGELLLAEARSAVSALAERDLRSLTSQLPAGAARGRAARLSELLPNDAARPARLPQSRLDQIRHDLRCARDPAASRFSETAFARIGAEVAAALPTLAVPPVSGLTAGAVIKIELPVRLDLAGGWSDTPPYCLERPACVLNLAASLDGKLPVRCEAQALAEPVLELEITDLGVKQRLTAADLARWPVVGDLTLLPVTAALVCGYVGRTPGGSPVIHQGVRLTTRSDVPKGSGLGVSSILAAAVVQALQRLAGRAQDHATISDLVLVLEQAMTTGGGWQDQLGGLVPGIKCLTSAPTRPLRIQIESVPVRPEIIAELERRLVVAWTGQERLAKNVLQIIVGRYLRRDRGVIGAIGELVSLAHAGRTALAKGDLDGLGLILAEVWRTHQRLDPHCSNPAVDAQLRAAGDLVLGAKLAGAGGGGFGFALAKDAAAAALLRERWSAVGMRVYRWGLWVGR